MRLIFNPQAALRLAAAIEIKPFRSLVVANKKNTKLT